MADLIPPGIRDARAPAWTALVDRLGELDLSVLGVYDVDHVVESALPHLAEQMHVMGYEGWLLAGDEAARRALLKQAIELHRHKGTPWAVRQACMRAGFVVPEIVERLPILRYDGAAIYDGREKHSGLERWALFRVAFSLDEGRGAAGLDAETLGLLKALVLEWKNVRSHLYDLVGRTAMAEEAIEAIDAGATGVQMAMAERLPWGLCYDGSASHDGAHRYSNQRDLLTFQVIYMEIGP